MELDLHIVKGPPVAKMSRVAAEKKLAEHPEVKRAASWKLRDIEGVWVAAVAVPRTTKQASPPPFAPAEEGPDSGPPSGAPGGPPSDEGDAPDDEVPGEDKPDDAPEGDEKGKGGVEHQVEMLTHMMHELMSALGLGGPPEGPMGHEGEPDGPPGPIDHNPDVPGDQGPDNKTHTVHERALKPGEAPPGTTPIGSPAYASVASDHPWSQVVGKKRTFTLEEPIGDMTMATVRDELGKLAVNTGYSVKRVKEGLNDSGQRVARVLVQADSPVN